METTISFTIVIDFIKKYRHMENSDLEFGFSIIKKIFSTDLHTFKHVCEAWEGKDKNFGSWYLNLSSRNQVRLLHLWDIKDPADQAFLEVDQHKNSEEYLWGKNPDTLQLINKFMVFFLNHGIGEHGTVTQKLRLKIVPPEDKRYGNSTNWGDYILSLDDPEEVLRLIYETELVEEIATYERYQELPINVDLRDHFNKGINELKIQQVISDLKAMCRLKESNKSSSFDSMEIEEKLSKLENKDKSKEYFLKVGHGHSILFMTYSDSQEDLLQIGNAICTDKELPVQVTIFQTTEYGGTAIYNHSPIGMILSKDLNTDRN